jgi:hypothetical protein
LELIQKSNDRKEQQWANLRLYQTSKWDAPIRLMSTEHQIRENIIRWETLSFWLVNRYQLAIGEVTRENKRAWDRMSIAAPQPENA